MIHEIRNKCVTDNGLVYVMSDTACFEMRGCESGKEIHNLLYVRDEGNYTKVEIDTDNSTLRLTMWEPIPPIIIKVSLIEVQQEEVIEMML